MSALDETPPKNIQDALGSIYKAARTPFSQTLRQIGLDDAAKRAEEFESQPPSPDLEKARKLIEVVRNSTLEELELGGV
jgi:hypothetical protein